jgi:NarL family two-component system response regulator LiaR
MHSVILVDDHPMLRKGIASWLEETGRFSVAGEASSLKEARGLFADSGNPADLVLLDIALGEENGLELIAWLKTKYNAEGPAVLVYSVFEETFQVQSALNLGARGYISKDSGEEEMSRALETVLNGGYYVNKRLAEKIEESPGVYDCLTKREKEILTLIQKNYTNGGIAKTLSISIRTVENYLSRIYDKTGAANRGELIKL